MRCRAKFHLGFVFANFWGSHLEGASTVTDRVTPSKVAAARLRQAYVAAEGNRFVKLCG